MPVKSTRLGKDVPHVRQGEDILPEATSIRGNVLGELAELVDRDVQALQLAPYIGVTVWKHQAEIDGISVRPAL
ncbi:MAG: hypothetical protein K0S14_3374 [Thermomicrobiales bacterium]|nr:hypothetical protein [Thermomicrobiales bacterium]